MTTYWVVATLVTCAAAQPYPTTQPCRMIENSYFGGHTIFLTKEECLAYTQGTTRRSCVEMHEEK
jgi:hypothetical protein